MRRPPPAPRHHGGSPPPCRHVRLTLACALFAGAAWLRPAAAVGDGRRRHSTGRLPGAPWRLGGRASRPGGEACRGCASGVVLAAIVATTPAPPRPCSPPAQLPRPTATPARLAPHRGRDHDQPPSPAVSAGHAQLPHAVPGLPGPRGHLVCGGRWQLARGASRNAGGRTGPDLGCQSAPACGAIRPR